MTPRSAIHSTSQPAVPPAHQQPMGAPVHQQMGMPMSYPAERPVRAVELVGAAYQQGGHRASGHTASRSTRTPPHWAAWTAAPVRFAVPAAEVVQPPERAGRGDPPRQAR